MSAVRSILGKSKHWLLSDFRSFKEAPYNDYMPVLIWKNFQLYIRSM